MRIVVLALVWLANLMTLASAQNAGDMPLLERITPAVLAGAFPGATRVEALNDKGPAAVAVYTDKTLVGYAFSTFDVLRAPGYSTTPFDAIAGVALDGKVTGAVVIFHREPYLLNDDHRFGLLVQFLDSLKGMPAKLGTAGGFDPTFVAGATISARAMRNAILEGAGLVYRFRTGAKAVTVPTPDLYAFRPMNGKELVAAGSIANVVVTNADLAAAMAKAGVTGMPLEVEPRGGPNDVYFDFKAGYALPPMIGRNAGGQGAYYELTNSFPEGTQALVFGSDGFYDHTGTKFYNLSHGFRLERIAVVQGDKTYEFKKQDVISAAYVIGRVANMLVLPPASGFDPLKPWRADVFAYVQKPDGSLQRFLLTSLDYILPAQHIQLPEVARMPAWMEPWVDQRVDIAILGGMLVVLTLILAFQGRLAKSRPAHRWIRNGFLLFTLVWLGWIASAQLSIVNLINYLQAPFHDYGWAFYLAEPLIVMIAIYTAVSLVLLGRGVFCGWLCPFGAMQELLATVARWLKLPQWNPSERIQNKLWLGKYISLGVVVGLAFVAPDAGAVAEEVEPFKTAITAMFQRGLPYVIWAVALLSVGLFTERAFCRFLCPLGGALAVLDRLHLVDMLKRRPQCGNPCHVCEHSCPVKAIQRSGTIKMAECFQCLDCMVDYYDDHRCPPLSQQRKQRERAATAQAKAARGAGWPGGMPPAPVPVTRNAT